MQGRINTFRQMRRNTCWVMCGGEVFPEARPGAFFSRSAASGEGRLFFTCCSFALAPEVTVLAHPRNLLSRTPLKAQLPSPTSAPRLQTSTHHAPSGDRTKASLRAEDSKRRHDENSKANIEKRNRLIVDFVCIIPLILFVFLSLTKPLPPPFLCISKLHKPVSHGLRTLSICTIKQWSEHDVKQQEQTKRKG